MGPAQVERFILLLTDFTMMVEDTSYMFVTGQCSENGY
jgi:acetyl-CoA carboxylase carboxyltransferase component